MKQYVDLCNRILTEGTETKDRTGVGTLSVFGHQSVYDLRNGFPLLTLKKTHWKSVVHELLWFISGDTNIKYLKDNGVRIWDEWADENGNLGPVYGYQWRNFGAYEYDLPEMENRFLEDGYMQSELIPAQTVKIKGRDQLTWLLKEAIKNPTSRRLIVSAWNPNDIDQMALPPCHTMWHVKLTPKSDGEYWIDLQLYQRSNDIGLGNPYNVSQYSMLLIAISNHINLYAEFKTTPRNFIHAIGDAHIYLNHVEQLKEVVKRNEYPLPKIDIRPKNIFELTIDDFEVTDYQCHPFVKLPVAV